MGFTSDDEDYSINGEEGDCSTSESESVDLISGRGDTYVDEIVDGEDRDDGLFDYNEDMERPVDSDDGEDYVDGTRGMHGKPYVMDDNIDTKLEAGMVFVDVKAFREALQQFVVEGGFDIIRLKNEKSRVTAICAAKGCTWRIHASPTPDGKTYIIKTYESTHMCSSE